MANKWDKVLDLLNNKQKKLNDIKKWYTDTLTSASNMLDKENGLALAIGLIDEGSFRIGNKESASSEDPSFGLSQLRHSHIAKITPEELVFIYRSKKGARETEPTIQKKVIRNKLLIHRLNKLREATEGNFSCGSDESDKNLFCFIDENGNNKELNTGHVNTKLKELGTIASAHNFRHVNANITLGKAIRNGESYRQGITRVAKQLGHMRVINGEKVFDVGNTAEVNYILPEFVSGFGKGHFGRNHVYKALDGKRDEVLKRMRTEDQASVWKQFLTQEKTPIIRVKDEWQTS